MHRNNFLVLTFNINAYFMGKLKFKKYEMNIFVFIASIFPKIFYATTVDCIDTYNLNCLGIWFVYFVLLMVFCCYVQN